MTLSCLIVLATLFSQMSSTLPQSATAKAIEIMFFAQIAHLTLVFVNHTILDIVRRREGTHVVLCPRNRRINGQKNLNAIRKKLHCKEKAKMESEDLIVRFPAHLVNSWTSSQRLEFILTGIEVLFFILFYVPFFLYIYLEKRKIYLAFTEMKVQ